MTNGLKATNGTTICDIAFSAASNCSCDNNSLRSSNPFPTKTSKSLLHSVRKSRRYAHIGRDGLGPRKIASRGWDNKEYAQLLRRCNLNVCLQYIFANCRCEDAACPVPTTTRNY